MQTILEYLKRRKKQEYSNVPEDFKLDENTKSEYLYNWLLDYGYTYDHAAKGIFVTAGSGQSYLKHLTSGGPRFFIYAIDDSEQKMDLPRGESIMLLYNGVDDKIFYQINLFNKRSEPNDYLRCLLSSNTLADEQDDIIRKGYKPVKEYICSI